MRAIIFASLKQTSLRLKTIQVKAKILNKLLESWKYLYQNDEVR